MAEYKYDGHHRRIVRVTGSVQHHDYYNPAYQVVEVRKGTSTNPLERYVWHPYYIDALAVRYYDANTDGTGVEHYASHDGNYNVTALYNSTGSVLERYNYKPYGQLDVLNASHTPTGTTSSVANPYTYTGRRFDPETGLYYYRNRYYDSQLGRFIGRDPIGYRGSQWNLYQYVGSQPTFGADPFGLWWWDDDWIELGVGGLLGLQGDDVQIAAGEAIIDSPFAEVGLGAAGGAVSGAATGAATGAVGGAIGGSVVPGPGTVAGAGAGALAGAGTGYVTGAITGALGALDADDPLDAFVDGAQGGALTGAVSGLVSGLGTGLTNGPPTPDPNDPLPPGHNDNWKYGPGNRLEEQEWRWWDENGGEWRFHPQDKHHPVNHWDCNPWKHACDEWRNVDLNGALN